MSSTITAPAPPAHLKPLDLPSMRTAYSTLLRADLTVQWRNRRSSLLVILVPVLILISWKGLIDRFGGAFVLSNCITVGLTAIGLMGYTNSIARDRDKGIFQRLRVAPVSNWTIMASRLTVQLIMITLMTLVIFIVGYQADHISMTAGGYAIAFLVSLIGGALYLSLGQVIVGLIKNPETVNAVTRLVYFLFIMIGMFGELGMLGDMIHNVVKYSPYGAVKRIVAAGLTPSTWTRDSTTSLFMSLGYTVVFSILGIRWFRWNNK